MLIVPSPSYEMVNKLLNPLHFGLLDYKMDIIYGKTAISKS
jgi:hypothetical protein